MFLFLVTSQTLGTRCNKVTFITGESYSKMFDVLVKLEIAGVGSCILTQITRVHLAFVFVFFVLFQAQHGSNRVFTLITEIFQSFMHNLDKKNRKTGCSSEIAC